MAAKQENHREPRHRPRTASERRNVPFAQNQTRIADPEQNQAEDVLRESEPIPN